MPTVIKLARKRYWSTKFGTYVFAANSPHNSTTKKTWTPLKSQMETFFIIDHRPMHCC